MENIGQTFRDNAGQEILFFYLVFFLILSLFYKGLNNGRATTPRQMAWGQLLYKSQPAANFNYSRYVDFGSKDAP